MTDQATRCPVPTLSSVWPLPITQRYCGMPQSQPVVVGKLVQNMCRYLYIMYSAGLFLSIYVTHTIFQSHRNLEAGDTQSLKFK